MTFKLEPYVSKAEKKGKKVYCVCWDGKSTMNHPVTFLVFSKKEWAKEYVNAVGRWHCQYYEFIVDRFLYEYD
jgi:hypothetical protein